MIRVRCGLIVEATKTVGRQTSVSIYSMVYGYTDFWLNGYSDGRSIDSSTGSLSKYRDK